MATNLRLEFYGEEQVNRTIARTTDRIRDARPLWEELADRFGKQEARQFRSEGRAASGGWAALSPRYAAWKARRFPGKRILERTGDLRRSLTERPFGIEVLKRRYMIVGSDVDYGEYHQKGGANLPRRRPVEFTENARRTWVKAMQRYIITGKTEGGALAP